VALVHEPVGDLESSLKSVSDEVYRKN
jgi:hypothetical protein